MMDSVVRVAGPIPSVCADENMNGRIYKLHTQIVCHMSKANCIASASLGGPFLMTQPSPSSTINQPQPATRLQITKLDQSTSFWYQRFIWAIYRIQPSTLA